MASSATCGTVAVALPVGHPYELAIETYMSGSLPWSIGSIHVSEVSWLRRLEMERLNNKLRKVCPDMIVWSLDMGAELKKHIFDRLRGCNTVEGSLVM